MKQTTKQNVNLNILLISEEDVTPTKCATGVLSINHAGDYQFEEEIRKKRNPSNPKLLDGNYVTMIRTKNGEYKFYLKQFEATPKVNAYEVAKAVGDEIVNAFDIIKA